jgi:hypothetical protein
MNKFKLKYNKVIIKFYKIKLSHIQSLNLLLMLRRFYSHAKLKDDYAIMTVALLQRNPIVMRPPSEIEKEYAKYRQNLGTEKARGTFNIGTASSKSGSNSAISVAAAGLDIPENVELNEEAHPKDLRRKLHRKLYLCLKDGGKWTLPMSRFTETDSALHSNAQTLLSEILAPSSGLQLYHLGAAPAAYHFDKFGDRVTPPYGAKHFFFRSQLVAGKIQVVPKYEEYGWFSKEELKEKLPNDFYESIEPIITE